MDTPPAPPAANETKKKTPQTVAEKLAKAQERQRAKHLKAPCVECGLPFGSHTAEMTYLCAMSRS